MSTAPNQRKRNAKRRRPRPTQPRAHVNWLERPRRLLDNGRGPLVLGVMSDAQPHVEREWQVRGIDWAVTA